MVGALQAFDPALAASLEYTARAALHTVRAHEDRQIELDVFADPQAGSYDSAASSPDPRTPDRLRRARLEEPGFKVLHVQEIDFQTRCLRSSYVSVR